MKKYRSESNGRRSFDTAIEYGTVAAVAREETRTAKATVRATRFPRGHEFNASLADHCGGCPIACLFKSTLAYAMGAKTARCAL